ncbi:MAG: response regulator transcription factor [Cyclobacteriaceae bacterium]|nr:response regulator transcription factor [Cyclobacteriaceae bacterium]
MNASCIIIDDEHPARVLLKEYVSKIPYLRLLGVFKNGMEALEYLNQNGVDIILLDIQMPELTGVEFLKTIPHKTKTIFTTAYSNYALDGYELDVVDYLLKPIRFERFLQAINKAMELIKLENKQFVSTSQIVLSIKADRKIHRVPIQNIKFIEGLKEYVRFHLTNEKLIALESLKSLEELLPSDQFVRIHKSFIVNKEKIKAISGNQVQIDDSYIPIGKSYREGITNKIF